MEKQGGVNHSTRIVGGDAGSHVTTGAAVVSALANSAPQGSERAFSDSMPVAMLEAMQADDVRASRGAERGREGDAVVLRDAEQPPEPGLKSVRTPKGLDHDLGL